MKKWLGVLTSLGCLSMALPVQAQTFPSKTITIVVTAAAGGWRVHAEVRHPSADACPRYTRIESSAVEGLNEPGLLEFV